MTPDNELLRRFARTRSEEAFAELVRRQRIRSRHTQWRQAAVQMTDPVLVNGTNADIGEMFNVMPSCSYDSSIITLNLIATLNQLTGNASRPGVATTQMSNQVSVFNGQTVALKADVPPGGWLPGVTNLPDGPWNLLVFVTPTLIDASGNRFHMPSQYMAEQEAAKQKMDGARQGVLAMLMFANDNQDQFPTNLEQLSSYLNNGSLTSEIESNFYLINPGSVTNMPAQTIVLREKQAWQGPNGNWNKTYGFADGHSEVHSEPSGNFDDFENQHTISAANP